MINLLKQELWANNPNSVKFMFYYLTCTSKDSNLCVNFKNRQLEEERVTPIDHFWVGGPSTVWQPYFLGYKPACHPLTYKYPISSCHAQCVTGKDGYLWNSQRIFQRHLTWEFGSETTFHLQIILASEEVLPNWFLASTETIYILFSNSPSAPVMVIVLGLSPEGRNSPNLWGILSGRVSTAL